MIVAEVRSEDVIALMNDTPAAGTALITQTEIAGALVGLPHGICRENKRILAAQPL